MRHRGRAVRLKPTTRARLSIMRHSRLFPSASRKGSSCQAKAVAVLQGVTTVYASGTLDSCTLE
jgi:hypothetical protein